MGAGDEEAWGACESQEVRADARPDSSGAAHLPGGWPCVLGAYLGRGSGEEPAGRWRGEACCLRARRGWECSGHFHCLQTEERRQQTEAGGESRGEHFKRESFGSPSPLPGGASLPSAQGRECDPPLHRHLQMGPHDSLIQPRGTAFHGLRMGEQEHPGQGPACFQVPGMAGRAIDSAPLSVGGGSGHGQAAA